MILQTDRVCKRIVACRRAEGLTQKESARRLDVDASTLERVREKMVDNTLACMSRPGTWSS